MSLPAHNTSIDRLRERIRRIETPRSHGVLPFGVAAIDRALPGGGLPLGALHEVLGVGGDEEDGAAAAGFIAGILARLGAVPGAMALPDLLHARRGGRGRSTAFLPLRPPYKFSRLRSKSGEATGREKAGRTGPGSGLVLWCLRRPDLYGPGLLAHGLNPARIVLVTARHGDEVLWAAEEALRAGSQAGLAAVVAEIGRLPIVAGRRLQLAAERSGTTAFLLRRWRGAAEAAAERERPSTALTRWRITALPSLSGGHLLGNPVPRWGRGGEGKAATGGAFATDTGRPCWHVELLRVRGGVPGSWEVEIADATGRLHLSAGLADRSAAPPPPRAGCEARRAG